MSANKSPAPTTETKMTLPKTLPWIFFVYAFTGAFNTVVFGQMMYFCTEYAGLSVTALTAFLTIARFVDFGVSLISGPIVQRSNTKRWGEYRPWIVGLPICTWIGSSLMFLNPSIPTTPKLVLVCISYMMLHLPMNFLTVAQNGLLAKVAGANPENRLAIASKRIQGAHAARIITSAVTLPLVLYLWDKGINGYFYVASSFGVITLIGLLIIARVTKPYDEYNPNKAEVVTASLGQMYGDAFKTKPLMVILIADILKQIAAQTAAGCVMYYYRFSAGSTLYQALAGTLGAFVALGSSFVAVPIARKLGKKRAHMVTGTFSCLVYALIAMFADGQPLLYITFTLFNSVGVAIYGSYGINLYLDIAEVRLLKTGIDNRPFIMSINNLPIKIGMIAGGPAVAWLLNTVGYEAGSMPNTLTFVRFMGFVPAVVYALTVLIVFFFFNISEEEAREAAAANQAAAKARAEAAAPVESKA